MAKKRREPEPEPKAGDLRVWHIPQVPGKPFHVPVRSLREALKILDALADYDRFQFENRIKPDYANVQGLEVLEQIDHDQPPAWVEWESFDGDNIRDLPLDSIPAD